MPLECCPCRRTIAIVVLDKLNEVSRLKIGKIVKPEQLFDHRTFESGSKNNWLLIRLVAAIAVIYGHSFGMFPQIGHEDITIKWLAHGITYSGQIAVIVFFFLSGAVVSGSLLKSRPLAFIVKRLGRVLPALIICLVLTSIAVIAVFPDVLLVDLGKYFVLNILNTINIGQFANIDSLLIWDVPGAFEQNQYHALNGSLWTLPQEIRLYALIFLFSLLSSKLQRKQFITLNLIFILLLLRAPELVPLIGSNQALLGNPNAVINSVFFLLGSIFFLLEIDKFKSRFLFGSSLFIYSIWLLFQDTHLLFFFAIVLFVLGFAKINLPKFMHLKGDYSYGVYLYGWPVGQFVAYFYPTLIPEIAFLIITLISTVIAIFSWSLIELKVLNKIRSVEGIRNEGK